MGGSTAKRYCRPKTDVTSDSSEVQPSKAQAYALSLTPSG